MKRYPPDEEDATSDAPSDAPSVKRAKATEESHTAIEIGSPTPSSALLNAAQASDPTPQTLNYSREQVAHASDPIAHATSDTTLQVAQSHASDPIAHATSHTTLNETRSTTSLADLNMDCMEIIFSYFDYVELVRAAKICKMWDSVAYYVMKKVKHYEFWKLRFMYLPETDAQLITMFKRTDLTSLDLRDKPGNMTGALMNGIKAHCPNLTNLCAVGVPFKKKTAMAFFAGLPKVTTLNLGNCGLTNPIFSQIVSRCKSLRSLYISNNEIEGRYIENGIFNITPKPNIKRLSIGNNTVNAEFGMAEIMEELSRLFPELEYLDLSKNWAGHFFEHIFRLAMVRMPTMAYDEHDYEDYAEDEKEAYLMSSLKSLRMRKIGGENTLLWWNGPYPIHPRLPNLEKLDLTDNCLSVIFLVDLSRYCPKLKSLDLSGCGIIFKEFDKRTPVAQSDAFNLIFPALSELEILKFNAITEHNLNKTDLRISGANLFNLVENLLNLTQLKVLELGEYPDMSNELIVKLIVGLPNLKQLNIHMCYNITFDFLTTLNAHPEFTKRKEKLSVMVFGSGLWDEKGFVPDMIELDFNEEFQLFEEYTCPFITGRARASGSFMDFGDDHWGSDSE